MTTTSGWGNLTIILSLSLCSVRFHWTGKRDQRGRSRRKSGSGGRREVIEYFNKITFFVRVNSLGGNEGRREWWNYEQMTMRISNAPLPHLIHTYTQERWQGCGEAVVSLFWVRFADDVKQNCKVASILSLAVFCFLLCFSQPFLCLSNNQIIFFTKLNYNLSQQRPSVIISSCCLLLLLKSFKKTRIIKTQLTENAELWKFREFT